MSEERETKRELDDAATAAAEPESVAGASGGPSAAPAADPSSAQDAGPARAAIRVQLPAFEGPLDLLLHLIQQNEIEITDIPIAKITKQYLEMLDLLRELDLEVAGEFLVMAATLMRIKARMLLPPIIEETEEIDPREGLVRQLLEYRRFKDAAKDLERLEAERRLRFERGAPAQLEDPEASELLPVSLFRLLDALKGALARQVPPVVHTIQAEPMRIDEAMSLLRENLRSRGRLLFAEMLDLFVTRLEKITAFLGLLELLKLGDVRATQEDQFGPIFLEFRPAESAAAPEPTTAE
ncbi:MAG TPA: segregation/condensation protein A [Candidatus Eisenbacteria bacterium]|nr:segregation/condensation protein A [Candidatus Eisenbacteria bacterium]